MEVGSLKHQIVGASDHWSRGGNIEAIGLLEQRLDRCKYYEVQLHLNGHTKMSSLARDLTNVRLLE